MGRWWEVSGDLFGGLEQLNKQTLKLALSYEGEIVNQHGKLNWQ